MLYLLYNPKSNNGLAMERFQIIVNSLEGKDYTAVNLIELTGYEELMNQVNPEDVIYLIGGDGTLNRFVNYIQDMELVNQVYFFSSGTGNDFQRDVQGTKNQEGILLNDYVKNLPVVSIYDKKYRFINGIGYGIDGYCCQEGDRLQAKSKRPVNYSKIAIKGVLYKFRPYQAKVTVDGETREYQKVWLAPTMIGRYFGGGIMIAPDQNRFNEEHMVTNVVMYKVGRLKALSRFASLFTGKHVKYHDMIDIRRGHEITVEFDRPCALQVDGETFLNVLKYSVSSESSR